MATRTRSNKKTAPVTVARRGRPSKDKSATAAPIAGSVAPGTRIVIQKQHIDGQGRIAAVEKGSAEDVAPNAAPDDETAPVTDSPAAGDALDTSGAMEKDPSLWPVDPLTGAVLGTIASWVSKGVVTHRFALWYKGARVMLTGDKNGKPAKLILVEEAKRRGIPLTSDLMAIKPVSAMPGLMTGNSQIHVSDAVQAHFAAAAAKFEDHNLRFQFLRDLTSDVCAGRMGCGMCTGGPGSGKTFEITKVIEDVHGLKVYDHIDLALDFKANRLPKKFALYVKGFCTKLQLYKYLYLTQQTGAILLFDDADSIFANQDTHNLLKAAMDSSKQRRVSYGTSKPIEDEETGMVYETRIVDYRGAIFIITNEDPKEMDTAIKSRLDGARVSIFLTPEQMIARMKECMVGTAVLGEFDEETQQQAIEFLESNLEFYGPAYSLRTLRPLCTIIDGDKRRGKDWKVRAEYTLYQMYAQLPEGAALH